MDDGALSADAEFTSIGEEWRALHRALDQVGPLRVNGAAELSAMGDQLTVRRFDLDLEAEDGSRVATLTSRQGLTCDISDERAVPDAYGSPVADVRLDSLPLGWLPENDAVSVEAGTIEGTLTLGLDAPDVVRLASSRPVTGRDIVLHTKAAGVERLNFGFSLAPGPGSMVPRYSAAFRM